MTFYYFADSYINFNSLVTDLFKIYKTRIWMSAINPASFVTPPTAGLHGPSGLSNPLYNQDAAHPDRRHQHDNRAYGGARDGLDPTRDDVPTPMGILRTAYADTYQPFSQPSRQSEAQSDPFGPISPTSYPPLETTGYVDYPGGTAASNGAARVHAAPAEWAHRFQGLSLNS